jgi:hypothetical protein
VRVGTDAGKGAGVAVGLLAVLLLIGARPQDTTVLAPDASAARAREVIQRAIQAMGGPAYLGVQDMTRTGRFSTFEHSGAARGTVRIVDLVKLPDKERIEYIYKTYFDAMIAVIHKTSSTFEVHNGDRGWTLTGGGVEEMPPDSIARVQEQRKKNINLLFRARLNEPDLVLRYTGQDTVDLKLVDWVEASDADRYTTRIAIDHATHLPVRAVFLFRDPDSRDPVQDDDYFSNYHPFQGIVTALQISHDHNGYHTSQVFLEDVKYNTGLSDSLFTRESLDQLWSKIGKGKSKGKD